MRHPENEVVLSSLVPVRGLQPIRLYGGKNGFAPAENLPYQ